MTWQVSFINPGVRVYIEKQDGTRRIEWGFGEAALAEASAAAEAMNNYAAVVQERDGALAEVENMRSCHYMR